MEELEWLLTSCFTSSPATDLSAREVENSCRPLNSGVRDTSRGKRTVARLCCTEHCAESGLTLASLCNSLVLGSTMAS